MKNLERRGEPTARLRAAGALQQQRDGFHPYGGTRRLRAATGGRRESVPRGA